MNNEKEITEILHNADDKTIENITEEFPQHDKNEADRLFREVEKRMALKEHGEAEDSVSGVEIYKKNIVRRIATIAACIAFVAAGTGTVFMLSKSGPSKSSSSTAAVTETATDNIIDPEVTEAIAHTEPTTDSTDNYSKSDIPEVITQEWLRDRCKNAENNFTRCYMETNENGMLVTKASDNQKGIKYYTTYNSGRIDYVYNEKRISIFEQTKEVIENPVENIKCIRYDGSLDDLTKWSVEGREEYLGRDCAVIRTDSDPVSSQLEEAFETQRYIDLETGITLRIGIYYADDIQYTVETLKFFTDDEATMIPTPQEIKKLITDNDYKIEDGLDLSFLDAAPKATAAETTETATAPAEMTTEAETVPITEAVTQNATESETKTTQPAEQVPDNIDKDYIIDLVSNNTNGINRLYARIKENSENYDEVSSKHSADVTIQYDRNKDCFCEFVPNETGEHYHSTDMIIYKDKLLATYKQHNHYHILSEIMPDQSSDNLRMYIGVALDQDLAQKDKWSITGRETVRSKDCAVIEYIEKSLKYVMYIDIKTGIVVKSHTIGFTDSRNKDILYKNTYEITELKLNDDAPEIVPSDFKNIIKEGGYEPEDEESKDLSFLDE